MSELTEVELLWLEKRIENRIRFGRAVEEKILDRRRRLLSFAPGSIFAFVRWTSNDFGTVISRMDILRAVAPGQRCSTVPYVKPGGEILLRLSGWPKVERALQLIDAVEALDINPADAAQDYWHHVHNRLSVNENPRSYTKARHQAWLYRQKVMR
ncbi:MAG: glycosidase [Bradyrhizobium sp.]|nr:glycosidase [Bradyrhizobium sp.]